MVFTSIRLVSLVRHASAADPTFYYVVVTCWTQAELAYSLMMAILPSLMPVMVKLDTSLGALGPQETSAYGESGSANHLRSNVKASQHPSSRNEVSVKMS